MMLCCCRFVQLWRLAGWLSSGKIDGFQVDLISGGFPAITKVCAAVEAHPRVQEWVLQHPESYAK